MDRDKLNTILENHKLWLTREGGERINLQCADLQCANLQYADLRRANLQCANLQYADLRHADLQGANLQRADLQGANLQGANLRGADLRDANLRGADLDFSCLPLWCGSKGMKVDRRIAIQILAHFCVLDCADKEIKEAQQFMLPLAKECHIARELYLA